MSNALKNGKALPLMEGFYTLQGEGFHTGKAAYFIRLGGCDVSCYWCDTKESWNSERYPLVPTDEIIKNIIACPAKSVIITGGEPLLYNLNYLCSQLKKYNFATFLETSGIGKLSGKWDWICLSPKQSSPPVEELFSVANELKVIISDKKDFKWAEVNASKVSQTCVLFLQPEWSHRKSITPLIIDYILKTPKWKLSIQAHKYLGIP